jgi:hypothetical protein
MTTAEAVNLTARPYRGLSVQEVDDPYDVAAMRSWALGRDFYRRTRYVLAHRGPSAALLRVELAEADGLFAPVEDLVVLSRPDELIWIQHPPTDVGRLSALCDVALKHRRPGVTTYAVTGRYEHVNFVHRPQPVTLYVDEVVPPDRPKLVEMVRQVVAFDEDLPPIRIVARLLSLPMLSRSQRGRTLLPCAGAGAGPADADYLDSGPEYRADWSLVGCTRSAQIYEHHYDAPAPRLVDICPERVGAPVGREGSTEGHHRLTKCCLLERGIRAEAGTATVPWGANLDEVRAAVKAVLGV